MYYYLEHNKTLKHNIVSSFHIKMYFCLRSLSNKFKHSLIHLKFETHTHTQTHDNIKNLDEKKALCFTLTVPFLASV